MVRKKGKKKGKGKQTAITNTAVAASPENDRVAKTLELCAKLNAIARDGIVGDHRTDPINQVAICQNLIKEAQGGDDVPRLVQHNPDRAASFAAFEEWLKAHKVEMNNIKFGPVDETNDVFGVFCTNGTKKGDVVMNVPRSAMLTVEDARTQPGTLQAFLTSNRMTDAYPSVALAVYLLTEKAKGNDSKYQPYLDILPSKFPGLPMYWTADEIQLLKGTGAYELAARRYLNCVVYYNFIYNSLAVSAGKFHNLLPLHKFTFDDFRWALAIAMTRQNPVPHRSTFKVDEDGNKVEVPPTKASVGLIPVYDMCNHEQGEGNAVFDTETDSMTSEAMRDFQQGEELTMHYGPRPNTELLIYSGFVMEPGTNSHDSLDFTLVLDEEDPLFPIKKLFVSKLKLVQENSIYGHFTLKASDTEIPSGPYDFSRIAVLTKPEAEKVLKSINDTQELGFVSDDHEERSKAYLKSSIEKLVDTQTLSDEIVAEQNDDKVNLPLQLATRLRNCENLLVQNALAFV